MKEKTIATYTTDKFRLQLLKLTLYDIEKPREYIRGEPVNKYQIRLNRKIIDTSISEYNMRKLFAMYVQNKVLKLKIY